MGGGKLAWLFVEQWWGWVWLNVRFELELIYIQWEVRRREDEIAGFAHNLQISGV